MPIIIPAPYTGGPGGPGVPLGAMGQDKTVTIRMQTLDGVWETVGSDRLRGVWPENDTYKANDWGPSTCSFDLKRDPGRIFPDLSAFTPCEVEIGGVQVWDGRVRETPIREAERVVNVQGFGWQFHLDDDQYQRVYVHERLSDYRDTRTFLDAPLQSYIVSGVVNADRGVVQLAWPQGAALPAADNRCGITLDLGQYSTAARIVVEWESSNNTGIVFYAQSVNNVGPSTSSSVAFSFLLNSGASGTTAGTFATPNRYVQLFLNSLGSTTAAADFWLKIRSVKVFTDAAYESGNVSVLKATDIIPDALDRATVLLSADRSGIDPDGTVTFGFPEFTLTEPRTPREVIAAANAVHGYVTQVAVGRRMIFKPKPSVPLIEIGAWPGSEFDDASANSAEDIYSRVIVSGTGPAGDTIRVEASQGAQSGVPLEVLGSPTPPNPSFATDATSWTASGGTLTRTTTGGEFHSAPGGGKWVMSASAETLTTTFSGTFAAGTTYVLSFAVKTTDDEMFPSASFGDLNGSGDFATIYGLGNASGFTLCGIAWSPVSARTSVSLSFTSTFVATLFVDSLQLFKATPTLADRRGFRRTHTLPIDNSLTPALGAKVSDVFLEAHKTTPLKGTVKIEGNQGCRGIRTGQGIPPERLLLMTEELLRLSHRTDPDTGGHGRDGRIAEVEYVRATDTAIVALDSQRTSHEALLKRLSVVVGN